MKNNDTILFNQISNGHKAAFDILFRKYYAQMVRFAIGYIHDGLTSEELVQDVFVKIWENAPRLNIRTSFIGYLYSSVKNHCLNYIKHEENKKKFEAKLSQSTTVDTDSVVIEINLPVFKQKLNIAVKNLPVKCREIFEMAKYEGLSYDEISEYLEVSVKTVENQMGIALKKLREAMLPFADQVYERK